VVEADPLSPTAWLWQGVLQDDTGQEAKGEVSLRHGLELAPSHAYLLRALAFSLLLQGRPAEALAIGERHPVSWMRDLLLTMAHHQLGQPAESGKAMARLEQVGAPAAYQIAQAHAWRGEKAAALDWLERGYATNDSGMRFTVHDPLLRGLRGEPRFTALLRKMNLPER